MSDEAKAMRIVIDAVMALAHGQPLSDISARLDDAMDVLGGADALTTAHPLPAPAPEPSGEEIVLWRNRGGKAWNQVFGLTPEQVRVEYAEATHEYALARITHRLVRKQTAEWQPVQAAGGQGGE